MDTDNLVNQLVARKMLERAGQCPDVAGDGRTAVEMAKAGSYALVLMDVEMPVLDGVAATRLIRAELPADRQPRIFALSAHAVPEVRAACAEAGMDGFIAKPLSAAALEDALAVLAP